MISTSLSDRIRNLPVRVVMAGFESDTWSLQNAGWEISASQDFRGMSLHLAFRHPVWKVVGWSSPVRYDFFMEWRPDRVRDLTVEVKYLSQQENYFVHMREDLSMFKPVDCVPEMAPAPKSMSDFALFKTVDHSKDLVVDPEDVNALMDQILKLQSPRQAEIRARERMAKSREELFRGGEAKPADIIHCQVISMRKAS